MSDLTVILPAYNEESTIGLVIDEVRMWMNCDILVADGKSTDATYCVALDRGVKAITVDSVGKGDTMRKAFKLVKTPYIIMMDSDHTYPATYLPKIRTHLVDGADVVMGYRKWRDPDAMSLSHWIGNRLLSIEASILFRYVRDVCTGMWGFRKQALDGFVLSSDGFTLEVDLFANTIKNGCRLVQIPISYRARPEGSETKLKVSDAVKIMSHLVKSWAR